MTSNNMVNIYLYTRYERFWHWMQTALILLLEWALAGPVSRLAASYGGQLGFGGLPWWQLALVPAGSALLGWMGARLVCARQLRRAG